VLTASIGAEMVRLQTSLERGIAGLVRPTYRPPEMLAAEPDLRQETTRELRHLLSNLAEGMAAGLRKKAN